VSARDFFGRYARMLGREDVPTAPEPLLRAGALLMEIGGRLTGTEPLVTREALRYVSRRAVYPNDLAREVLGWEPRVDLDEGMRRTERWLREEGLIPAPA
jgi:nucleoside-diphosphate-sugar epimerase